jgi:pyruvate,water dikinase
MGEQMLANPSAGGQRFGDRSYAIVSDKYVNFSSRVGYHYGIVDSYCGNTQNNNYISFSFKGGAAGDEHRSRRARSIALILERLGFNVETQADRVASRFQKATKSVILERLDIIGRLLQFTRQMDMLMADEVSVRAMAESFLSGDYQLREYGKKAPVSGPPAG